MMPYEPLKSAVGLCLTCLTILACQPTKDVSQSLGVAQSLQQNADEPWLPVEPGYQWDFPRDHYQHPGYKIEWWYLTGHLWTKGAPLPPRFGYQLTFFKIETTAQPQPVASDFSSHVMVMGHLAVSDSQAGKHGFSEALFRVHPQQAGFGTPPDKRLVWVRAPAGNPGRWSLDLHGDGFHLKAADANQGIGLDLQVTPAKKLVLQGDKGFSRKGAQPRQATLYYSLTRLESAGTITIGGESYEVEGMSWMDKEIGSQLLTSEQAGWDWFSLQFVDGSEAMLFQIRDRQGQVSFSQATEVDRQGKTNYSKSGAWSKTPKRFWQSPTGSRYPVDWQLASPRGLIEVRSRMDAQENVSGHLRYWEGALDLYDQEGRYIGFGFLEMTGR